MSTNLDVTELQTLMRHIRAITRGLEGIAAVIEGQLKKKTT